MEQTYDVELTRVFDAPLERAWRAWVEPEDVLRWWGPEGFTATVARMDFREGGTSLVAMRAPADFGGGEFYNTWTYTSIVSMQRFEYVARFSDEEGNPLDPADLGIPPGVPKEVHNVNVFEDLGDGKTRLTITERSYSTEEAREMSRQGLDQCLDKMAALIR